ncbi:MAG: ferredoxin-like protein [Gudongella sp.]|nr:ferredoxin-like protein [Gudongella sp.]
MEENTKKKFLERETTRRDFLKLTGKSLGGVAISMSILSMLGCESEQAVAYALPTGLLIADPTKCTGCQRCELTCTSFHDGKIQPYISRVKVAENYNFGTEGPKIDYWKRDGEFGNLMMNPETCKQCREPYCGRACPVGAISADPKQGNARVVDTTKCIGCGACEEACPWGMPTVDPETKKSTKCVACGLCAEHCPTGALTLVPWEDVKKAMRRSEHRFS